MKENTKGISQEIVETERQSAEMEAMRRMLNVSRGVFSISVAVCNSPALRDYLIEKLCEQESTVEVIKINDKIKDVFEFVQERALDKEDGAIFIVNLEGTLTSVQEDYPVLRGLNATRELWKAKYNCPVVFWAPEYVAVLLSIHARDFWSWRSHQFEFVSEMAGAATGTSDAYAGDIGWSGNLDAEQKQFRIAELEQRIQEAGDPPKEEFVSHVLVWLNELGYLQKQIGELSKSEKILNSYLDICKKLGRNEWMSNAYGNLGLIYGDRGEMAKAEEMHKKALEINKLFGQTDGMAINYGNLGLIYADRGELDKAEDMHKKALEINEKTGRSEGLANNYGNLGLIFRARGELDKAEEMLKKALKTFGKIFRREGMANTYGNLGIIYADRGELDKAEEMHKKSLEINEQIGQAVSMARDYSNLGGINKKRGEIEKAREKWQKARDLYRKIGMPQMVEQVEGWLEGLKES